MDWIRFTLGDYQRPNSHKIAISLPELVQQTNSFSVKNRPGCVPTLLNSKPNQLYLKYNVTCHLKSSDPAGHTVQVQFDIDKVEETHNAKDLDIKVTCSCPAFLYWGAQWNSYQRDALFGEPRPLLQAPSERLDLRSHFVICKHCKAVFERILPSVQNNVNTILRQRDVEKNKEKLEPSERLKKKQDEMKKRHKPTPEEKTEQVVLEGLGELEAEKLLKEQELGNDPTDHVVVRDEPAVEPDTQEMNAPELQPPTEVEPLEPEPTPEPVPEPVEEPKKHKPNTDRELLERMKQKEQERLQNQQTTRNFLEQKYKRKRTSQSHINNFCPQCGGNQKCRCPEHMHAGGVPATYDICGFCQMEAKNPTTGL